METNCKQCNKGFKTKPSRIKNGNGKFCSRQCYYKWQSLNPRPNRFDIKKYKENNPYCEKNRLKAITGKPLSDAHKKKLSEINILNGHTPPVNEGENHPNWKGGKSLYWKKQARIRDKNTCQICQLNDKDLLDVHHIIPVKSEYDRRYKVDNINNLITLCVVCHRKVHKKNIDIPAHFKRRAFKISSE